MIRTLDVICARTHSGLGMRVGIHRGEVVAGVIGKKKFTYDLWGDAVNTASRMESHGVIGKIHVSHTVVEHIQESNLRCISRGEIEIKGKGMMHTYIIEPAML
jgi:adenylate cyclase